MKYRGMPLGKGTVVCMATLIMVQIYSFLLNSLYEVVGVHRRAGRWLPSPTISIAAAMQWPSSIAMRSDLQKLVMHYVLYCPSGRHAVKTWLLIRWEEGGGVVHWKDRTGVSGTSHCELHCVSEKALGSEASTEPKNENHVGILSAVT